MSDSIDILKGRQFDSDFDKILHQIGLDKSEVSSILDGSIRERVELEDAEYEELRKSTMEFIASYGSSNAPADDEVVEDFHPLDYMNGNVQTIDKSAMSEEFKIANGLDGIPDEMYEVCTDRTVLYYDMTTANTTFYQMHILLKKLGIKNNRAHLLLFDRELLGVDPFDPYLSQDMRARVYTECRRNIFYYFREVYRYPAKVETEPATRFALHLGNLVYLWLNAQCFNTYIELPRQTGKTFVVFGAQGYDYDIGSTGATIVSMHYIRAFAIKNKNESVIRPLNSLPKYLRLHAATKKTVKGETVLVDNEELNESDADKMLNVCTGTTHRTVVPGNTESQAYKAGRGLSPEFIGIDEVNFIKEIAIVLTSIIYAFKTASDIARRQGRRYGITLLSTPGDLNTKNGQYMHNIIYNEMCEWHHRLFDKDRAALHKYLAQSKRAFFRIKYDYDDLGLNQNWLEEQIANNGIGKGFRTDVMLQWEFDSSDSPYDPEAVKRLVNIAKDVSTDIHLFRENYPLVYMPVEPGDSFDLTLRKSKFLSIGIDTATGVNSENSAIYALDLNTGKPVFTYMSNTIDVPDFSVLIRSLVKYIKSKNRNINIIVNVERDGVGQPLVKLLTKDSTVVGLLAYTVNAAKSDEYKYSEKTTKDNRTAVYGLRTKGRRDGMFDNLKKALETYPYMLASEILTSQISTLIIKNNKIQHATGCCDDMVFAAMNALAPIFEDDVREQLFLNYTYRINYSNYTKMPMRSTVSFIDEEIAKEHDGVHSRKVSYFDGRSLQSRIKYYRLVEGIEVELNPSEEDDYLKAKSSEMNITEKVIADEKAKSLRSETFSNTNPLEASMGRPQKSNNDNFILDFMNRSSKGLF